VRNIIPNRTFKEEPNVKRIFFLALVLTVLLGACQAPPTAAPAPTNPPVQPTTAPAAPTTAPAQQAIPEALGKGGITVAVIRNLPSDDHTKQFLDGARSEGESFGFKVDTFIADNDDAKFQELVAQAIAKGYTGLVISHGKKDYSYDMLKPAVDKGIKVVTFDTVIDKDGQTLPEITTGEWASACWW